ncbi:MAG: yiaD [Chitinophagaceae bacterium]|nr:yiaD [Chitinophagaceae bacterium]
MNHISLFIYFIVLLLSTSFSRAQQAAINLVKNGDFELGDEGFTSDYQYIETAPPGCYAIAINASSINKDFKNPIDGDHSGRRFFLVCNGNGEKGMKIWSSKVRVVPNTRYEFSAYFCNIYKRLPPKLNFEFLGGDVKGNDPKLRLVVAGQEVAIERDFYHVFQWIRISGTWYSGVANGEVRIHIENLNQSVSGNDVALDDISFTYLETMPPGYTPPQKINTVVAKNYVAPKDSTKAKLSNYGDFDMTDTIAPGVYVVHHKKKVPVIDSSALVIKDTLSNKRIELHNLIFSQTKAELLPEAKAELNAIASWLARDSTVRIRFIGHTDNQGDSVLNVKLSQQRVANAKRYLISKGIAADRIETLGLGGAFPIADNSTKESRQLNRRVEMEILSK